MVVGLTELVPSAAWFGPPLIDTLSALVVVQVSVAASPAVIVASAAEKLSTTGAAGGGAGSPLGVASPVPEMASHFPPWLETMLIVPVLSGATEEFFSRKFQIPKLSTDAVPSITAPGAVGPVYKVMVLPGPGIELVPPILHSLFPARNSN